MSTEDYMSDAERTAYTDSGRASTHAERAALYEQARINIANRLEYLRTELRAERISTGELIELRTLVPHIAPGDTELLEAAGVPENELLCDGCGHAINPDTDYHTPEDEAYHPDCCPECKISVHIIHKASDWLRE